MVVKSKKGSNQQVGKHILGGLEAKIERHFLQTNVATLKKQPSIQQFFKSGRNPESSSPLTKLLSMGLSSQATSSQWDEENLCAISHLDLELDAVFDEVDTKDG